MENIKNQVFKAILKYKNHPSILAIRDTQKKYLCFKKVTIEEIEKEINTLSVKILSVKKFCRLKVTQFF